MNVYLVGGAVRDQLLGRKPREYDYVVVGATPELMIKKGFKQVGRDFPVFLHPKTNEEYALARTEKSQVQVIMASQPTLMLLLHLKKT